MRIFKLNRNGQTSDRPACRRAGDDTVINLNDLLGGTGDRGQSPPPAYTFIDIM
ncbi:MAG: hypothetical protein FWG68_03275 [Defluviitaleaceae bacterium]|nr:hypothetical protein [Defluviitaleaceae bacterium]